MRTCSQLKCKSLELPDSQAPAVEVRTLKMQHQKELFNHAEFRSSDSIDNLDELYLTRAGELT